jgi:NTP pyrophosphatase (non-canonical NTP hydrolase)
MRPGRNKPIRVPQLVAEFGEAGFVLAFHSASLEGDLEVMALARFEKEQARLLERAEGGHR